MLRSALRESLGMLVEIETRSFHLTVGGNGAKEPRRKLCLLELSAALRFVPRPPYTLAGTTLRAVAWLYLWLLRRGMDQGGTLAAALEYRIIHQGWT